MPFRYKAISSCFSTGVFVRWQTVPCRIGTVKIPMPFRYKASSRCFSTGVFVRAWLLLGDSERQRGNGQMSYIGGKKCNSGLPDSTYGQDLRTTRLNKRKETPDYQELYIRELIYSSNIQNHHHHFLLLFLSSFRSASRQSLNRQVLNKFWK